MFYKKAVHPCLLFAVSYWNQNRILFSDAIAQPASVRCSSRVWVFPTSILQSKISRCIYVCIACNNYEASQCDFQIWKLFSNQDRPFSSSTWSGRLFFLRKFSHLQSQQAGIQHKNALVPHLNGRWISKFSWKNSFLKNRRWFIQYHTKPELLLPVLKAKSGSITS